MIASVTLAQPKMLSRTKATRLNPGVAHHGICLSG